MSGYGSGIVNWRQIDSTADSDKQWWAKFASSNGLWSSSSWSRNGAVSRAYHIFPLVASSLLIAVGLFVLYAVVRNKQLRKAQSMTVSNSALADVFIGLSGIAGSFILSGPVPNTDFNDIACKITGCVDTVLYSWTYWAVALMAIDCFVVVAPTTFRRVTGTHVIIIVVFVLIESATFAGIPYGAIFDMLPYGLKALSFSNRTAICSLNIYKESKDGVDGINSVVYYYVNWLIYYTINWLIPVLIAVLLLTHTAVKQFSVARKAEQERQVVQNGRAAPLPRFQYSNGFKYVVTLIILKVCLGFPYVAVSIMQHSGTPISTTVSIAVVMVSKCSYLFTCVFYFMWVRSLRLPLVGIICGLKSCRGSDTSTKA